MKILLVQGLSRRGQTTFFACLAMGSGLEKPQRSKRSWQSSGISWSLHSVIYTLREVLICHFAYNFLSLTVFLRLTIYSFGAMGKLGKAQNLLSVYDYVLYFSYNHKHNMGASYENRTDDIR